MVVKKKLPLSQRYGQALQKAAEIDWRRQRQILNQSNSITRLLVLNEVGPDPEAATKEIARLNEELANEQQRAAGLEAGLAKLLKAYDEDPETLEATADDVRGLLDACLKHGKGENCMVHGPYTSPAAPAGENEEDDNG